MIICYGCQIQNGWKLNFNRVNWQLVTKNKQMTYVYYVQLLFMLLLSVMIA